MKLYGKENISIAAVFNLLLFLDNCHASVFEFTKTQNTKSEGNNPHIIEAISITQCARLYTNNFLCACADLNSPQCLLHKSESDCTQTEADGWTHLGKILFSCYILIYFCQQLCQSFPFFTGMYNLTSK